jgi:Spy/CpxP family protein refolding chaperone
MNRRTLSIIALVLAGALALAAPVLYAQRPPQGPRGGAALGPFGHLEGLREELGLSDQQVEDIKAIFRNLRDQNEPYREQLRDLGGDTFNVLLQNPNDIAAAQAIADQQAAAERAMKVNGLNATAAALKVLTTDQREDLAELLKERRERRRP